MACRQWWWGCRYGSTGRASDETARVAAFIDALKTHTTVPIVTADERLTSREAESRLSVNERDWRERKKKLDAAAAAIILQEYLDRSRALKPGPGVNT